MNKAKHFKRLWGTLLLLVVMLLPQGAWAANHYDAGYESTATTYSAAGIKFKITAVRMYNYQGNNSQFRSNPLVTITAGGHTHTFYLGSLTSNTGKDTFYYNGEGNENPYKGSGSFSKVTYQQTVDGIPVKAYFDNQKNEQRVSTNPDKTYKDNGDGSNKWCTADLTIEIGVQTAAMVTIAGNWGDYSDGINKTESYSWPFNIPKHTCNSDIQSNTYRESAATCTAAAVYHESCSWCGAAQSGTFTSGSALGHSYGAGSWSWEDDGHTATCTRTCTRTGCTTNTTGHTSSKSVTLNNGITDEQQVAPSCTGKGTTRYKATATVEGTQYTATKDVQDIAALGHSYGAGAWSWADDGHSATCTRTCTRTDCTTNTTGHTSSKSVTLNNGITDEQQVAPKCTEKGTTLYTATATVEGTQYKATKEVVDIAALGHSYGAGSWSWADDGHSATCTRTCGRTGCTTNTTGHTSSKSVTLNNGITPEQQVAPKCTEKGTTLYTATATVEGTQYKATKEVVDIAVLGHSYGAGSWSWADDGHSATCTRTCGRTGCTNETHDHAVSVTVSLDDGITWEVTKDATCAEKGTTTYTAKATVAGMEYTDINEVVDVAMLSHKFDHHVCTVCSADEQPITGTQGECTWRLYASDGEMIVSPTNGVSGSLGNWSERPSWYEQRTAIKSVRFTGSVTAQTLDYAFFQCNATSIDLTNLNTSQVQNMSDLFNQCKNLTTINWGSFDTSNATDISFMFNECFSLTSLDLRCFNTSNVTLMNSVFQGCEKLTSVDLSSFNTGKVEKISGMFNWCYKLTNLDLSNFNTANATQMSSMFAYCGELQSLTIGNFDMSKVTTSNDMFVSTNKLSTLTLTSVPYLKEGTFDTKFTGKTVICQLNDNSTVYEGENYLPTITQCNHHFSVTDAFVAANCGETGLTEGSHCKVCAEVVVAQEVIPNSGNHTFSANDLAKSECTVCSHGFFRYTATAKVDPWAPYELKNADGVSIYNAEKHTFADGKGVMEFDSPLAEIGGSAFMFRPALTAIDLRSISLVGTDAFAECPNLTSVTARCDLDLSDADINEDIVTRIHDYAVMSDDETYLATAANCGNDATYYYKCVNCAEHNDKTWAKEGTGNGIHTFAADDPTQGECTVCHHGFFRYTSSEDVVVSPKNPAQLKAANYETLTIVKNTNVGGQGIIEFNKPLVEIGARAFFRCTNFTGKLTIPSTVTKIGSEAFHGCTGFTGDLTIPDNVKVMENQAFAGCTGFNGKLTISNSLDSIPLRAFDYCKNLTGDIVIPNSVKEIGMYAFRDCYGFNGKLSIPNSVEIIDAAAFENCSGLQGTLTIPESVRWIERSAFKKCSGFERVEIKSLPYIEWNALSEIATTNKVLTLSENSYIYRLNAGEEKYDFPEVISATAPCTLDLTNTIMEGNSVLTLSHNIVTDPAVTATCGTDGTTEGSHCKACAEVFVAQEVIPALGHTFAANDPTQSVCTVCHHGFFRYTATAKVQPYQESALKNSENQGIYNAEKHTFADGKGVMEFDEPLTSIGAYAFYKCSGFTGDLTIPNSVISIGERAFYECPGFTGNLTIPNSVISIGEYAFYKCSGFNGNLTIPNSVTSIGNSAFRLCSGFKGNLTIPNSVTSIGNSAFEGCSGFTGNLTIPNSVISIGESAFYKCSGFNGNLTIPNSVTSIGQFTFNGCGFTGDLTIPNSVTSIGYTAFLGCSGFTGNLTIPNSITSIGDWAFSGCSGFTGVIFQSVPQIGGSRTFSNVTSNKTVVLSDNSSVYKGSNPNFPEVVSATAPCTLDLTDSAVENHANLTRTHECTVESEADAYLASAAGCADATYYYKCANCDEHGTKTWAKEGTGNGIHTFAANDLAKGECTVCHHGFFRYTSDKDVVVSPKKPAELKAANNETLTIVSNTNVNGEGVMEFNKPLAIIGALAFEYCQNFIGKLTIPSTVTRIESKAFAQCNGFTGDLTIPNSVEDIGREAFAGCTGFNGKLTLSNQLDSISSFAFRGCNNLTGDLVIPNSVKEIGMYAFSSCSGFNGKLSIPNSVKIIDYLAFYGCSGLKGTLTIPESVRWIERGAFAGCSGFSSIEMRSLPYMENIRSYAEMPMIIALNDDSYVSDDFSGDEVQSATYTRRGVKNQWGTIVMPFDVANGDDYDLYTLAGASASEITLTKVTTTLEAGTPAVIRLKDGKASADYTLTLTGVATAESASTTVSAELYDGTEADGLQLVGTYRPTELAAADYFISNNKFWRAADFLGEDKSVKASPFRAYLKGVTVNAKASSLRITIGSDSTTDMLNAITEGDSEYYDLNGRRSGSLQKGVNIVKMNDGTIKKITVK